MENIICKRVGCVGIPKYSKKYCSKKCYWEDKKGKVSVRKGIKHTKETKQRIKETKLEQAKDPEYIKKLSDPHIGQIAWNKGVTFRKFKKCKKTDCNNLVTDSYKRKYCSKECYLIDRSENNPMKNEEIRSKVSKSSKGRKAWNKGLTNIYSEETLNKIREARAKQVFSEESKDKKSKIMKESWANEEFREKQLKNAFLKKGSEHPFWLEGISFEPYGLEFNKELKQCIKNRDFHTCQTPGCMNTNCLVVHHIDYNKRNNNPENLITLCRNCHSKTNFNRQYFTEFYTNITTLYL